MITPSTNIAAQIIADEGQAKPQSLTDTVAIVGAIIDTQPAGAIGYRSALMIAGTSFTTSGGASGGQVTALLEVYHDTASNMATEASLDSDSYVYTWAANGANYGVHCLPVSLETANRYIRGKFTETEAGTITVASAIGYIAFVLGGMTDSPDAGYAAAGYETTVEPS
jgi:hypothetical protein